MRAISSPRTRTAHSNAFAPDALRRDWQALCAEIGERRAGTPAERQAAEYIAQQFRATGLQVKIENYACASLRSSKVEVHERKGRGWQSVDAAVLVGAPGTPGGRPVTGKLVWLELPEAGRRLQPGSLRGCIVAVFGPLPTDVRMHRRLVAADPLAVIHVDERLPYAWTKADGVYPHWARTHGMRPTISVPYTDAWRWRRDGVAELKVRVAIDLPMAESPTVIAELPGTEPRLPGLVLTAHHDTQCGNVGADDNASGVVCLLALARAFAGRPQRRTLRLISFGAEEQLSVGSAAYARAHRPTPREIGLAVNFDSVASPLGHWIMSVAGDGHLARFAVTRLASLGLDVAPQPEIIPFSDHFPFNRCGIPSVWFMRTNSSGGRWQHHSPHDSLDNVSAAEVQRLLTAVQPFITGLASAAKWPFSGALPAALHAEARKVGRELYG